MARILLTAFKPFDGWETNASWLALQALMRELPAEAQVTTRLYPVDYDELRPRLAMDLATPYDVVLHLGQAAGASSLHLEQFALNARRQRLQTSDLVLPLESEGPAAYRSNLPLAAWTRGLRETGVPAELSLHAGDYLCNAAMYWSHYLIEAAGRQPNVAFVHVPIDISQAIHCERETPSLPTEITATALRLLVGWATDLVSGGMTLAAAEHTTLPNTLPNTQRGEA